MLNIHDFNSGDMIMHLEMWLTIFDEKGRIESHQKANSPVLAMIDILYTQMSGSTTSITDTSDLSKSPGPAGSNYRAISAAGDATMGIVVGTDDHVVEIAQNKLLAKVAHGSSGTQVSYGQCTVGVPQTSQTSRQLTISRIFTGNPTADVNVKEVGIYVWGGGTAWYFCIDRSLNSFTIPIGTSKTVTYTIKVTV